MSRQPPIRPRALRALSLSPAQFSLLAVLALSCAGLMAPAPARAAWPSEGMLVCGAYGLVPMLVPGEPGSSYLVWDDHSHGYSYEITAARILDDGTFPAGWQECGVPILSGSEAAYWEAAPDGMGGLLVAWEDRRVGLNNIYAQRVDADGQVHAGWVVNGVAVCTQPTSEYFPRICADGTGGAYVGWDDTRNGLNGPGYDTYVQHLAADGTVWPGWPVDGMPVTVGVPKDFSGLVPDGTGGVVLGWLDASASLALRLQADGTPAPGWAAGGNVVVVGRGVQQVIADGTGGAYFGLRSWNGTAMDVYGGRILGTGVVAPGWPLEGRQVVTNVATDQAWNSYRIASDGLGGVLFVWDDWRYGGSEVWAERLNGDGTLPAGWQENGNPAITGPYYFMDVSRIAPDGTGGAYIACEGYSGTEYVFAQRLSATGQPVSGYGPNGDFVTPNPGDTPAVISDGAGGAIVAWEGRLGDVANGNILAQRLEPDGPVAVAVTLAGVRVEGERVEVEGYVTGGAGEQVRVERREESTGWEARATVLPDGAGHVRWEDAAVELGMRYGYRLAYDVGGETQVTGEQWVTVPGARFALEGLVPNPSSAGALVVGFTLAEGGGARLALYDVSGRKVAGAEVGGLGPGRHVVRLVPVGRVAPGVYVVELEQGSRRATARAVVME